MTPRYGHLVSPSGSEYNNTKSVDGIELVVNTTIEDAKYVNRVGVMESSIDPDIPNGSEVLIHHNVFRTYLDMRGRKRRSNEYLRDSLYLVDPDRVYLFKSGDRWRATRHWCFVKPIDYIQDSEILRQDKEQRHTGVVVYSNLILESMGITEGTLVGFTRNSEYAFEVDDEKMYRMKTDDICLIVNE